MTRGAPQPLVELFVEGVDLELIDVTLKPPSVPKTLARCWPYLEQSVPNPSQVRLVVTGSFRDLNLVGGAAAIFEEYRAEICVGDEFRRGEPLWEPAAVIADLQANLDVAVATYHGRRSVSRLVFEVTSSVLIGWRGLAYAVAAEVAEVIRDPMTSLGFLWHDDMFAIAPWFVESPSYAAARPDPLTTVQRLRMRWARRPALGGFFTSCAP